MTRAKIKHWLPALILVSLLVGALVEASIVGITLSSALRWIYATLKESPWVLLLLCAVRPPFIVPISWLGLLCGALWGLWLGGLYAIAGMLTSAACSYAIAKFVVPSSKGQSKKNKFNAWLERKRQDGFMSVVLMRLMLLPFDVVNFAAATLKINLREFMLATLIGNAAVTLIYTSIGASVRLDIILSGGQPPLSEIFDMRQLAIAIFLLVISLALAAYVKKRSNAPDEIEEE